MRKASVKRKTKETEVEVMLNLDGSGDASINTPIRFLNHLLAGFAKHGCFDLQLKAGGDLPHHIAEDCMIALGTAFEQALGRKTGIERIGDALVPMDDALILVAVDLSGRAYFNMKCGFRKKKLDDLSADLFPHLLQTFATSGKFNLHVEALRGTNDHHKAEAVFKALGVALRRAAGRLPKRRIPSTKGVV
jgi:imidazoleglycerol-phosphate dehydratase